MGKHFVTYGSLCVLLASCAGSGTQRLDFEPAYVINKLHLPLLNASKQIQLEGSLNEWFELASGYAVNDYLAVVGSIRFLNPKRSDSDFHQYQYFDLGAGYFMRNEGSQRFEALIRIGNGYTNVVDRYDRRGKISDDTLFRLSFYSYDFMKYFLQVNGGWEWEHWALGGSLRFGYMHLHNLNRLIKTLPDETIITNSNAESKGGFFYDVGLILRYIIDPISIEYQGSFGKLNQTVGFSNSFVNSSYHSLLSLSIIAKF